MNNASAINGGPSGISSAYSTKSDAWSQCRPIWMRSFKSTACMSTDDFVVKIMTFNFLFDQNPQYAKLIKSVSFAYCGI